MVIHGCFKGYMVPKRLTFPSGIKALADYVHGKGLKLGWYLLGCRLADSSYSCTMTLIISSTTTVTMMI
uniref:Uncharacterized protein n=1 Tax=Musa acuminata subsp. malaccensis TaxID=214687 RepID=A0A804K663_MUSAM